MRRARPDRMDRPLRTGSLRRHVALAVLTVLLAVIIAICASVNVILSHRLYDDARHQIVERAQYASVLGERVLTPQELADSLTGQGITASVLSGGQVTVGRERPPQATPGAGGRPPPRGPRPAESVPITVTEQAGSYVVELTVTGGELRLSYSLAEIRRTISTLHTVEVAVGIGTLSAAALIVMLVVGVALAPLRRMRTLADRIRSGTRGIRLRPTRPTTDLGRTALAIDEMLEALEAAEVEARAAELRMRGVLADVSHDLRTPIAGVIAAAEQLLRTDPPRAEREQRLVDLIRESRRAARLVDDLLLMARLDAASGPELPPPAVDVAAVVALAVSAAQSARQDRTISLMVDAESGPQVEIDPDRLTRVLTNLLDNARNATVPGGSIEVSVTTSGPDVQITVADDGPGVPRCDQERIFDRLVRLDPARRSGGSGLGLPIARAVARAAGGDVRYVEPGGCGACFEVRLPITVQAPAPRPVKIAGDLVAAV